MKTISALLVWCLPAHFKSFLSSSSSSSIPDSVAWWISALVSPFVSYYQPQLRLQLQVLSGYTLPPSGGSPVVCESWHCITRCESLIWWCEWSCVPNQMSQLHQNHLMFFKIFFFFKSARHFPRSWWAWKVFIEQPSGVDSCKKKIYG